MTTRPATLRTAFHYNVSSLYAHCPKQLLGRPAGYCRDLQPPCAPRHGTFEIDPPTEREMGARRPEVLARGLPYLVAEHDRQVVGYAYCNWFRPLPVCRFSAEDSVYLDLQAQVRGLGRTLLAERVTASERAGVLKLIAVIGDSENLASVRLHQRLRFAAVGVLKSCGFKFERWLDVVLMGRASARTKRETPASESV